MSGIENIVSSFLNITDRKSRLTGEYFSLLMQNFRACRCINVTVIDPTRFSLSLRLTCGTRRSSGNPISWRVTVEVNQVVDLCRPLLKQTKH